MSELPKQYNPKEHESKIYQQWEESGSFKPNEKALKQGKAPFVVTLPPPNITGSLHMGHALNSTIQDVLVRYHRMLGEPALWIPGTDHAGIATQNVVEKELRKEGLSRHELGREKFLERVWQWREKYGHTIIEQLKKLGASCDWSHLVFTLDESYARAVTATFVAYYNRGYIYRGNRIVNWCPRCASVISDLEIKHVQQTGKLTTLKYPLADNSGEILVATTRPETMLGDAAVAVNPNDERYRDVIGKKVKLPLVGREIPIVADERVDQAFGTGAVKVTPAHDPLDAEIGETHKLPIVNVIGEDGHMTEAAGEFAGLTVEEARAQVLNWLSEAGAIVGEQEHVLNMTLCDRCRTTIQPLISRQWFVNMSQLKEATIEAVSNNLVQFHPPRWRQQLLNWMNNVRDWTISRQLWWGHQIPVWWKPGVRGTANEEGSFVVAAEKPSGDWERDPDVLDTWFSSALWPFATLGWPDNTADLKNFYPTSLLSTARDILYLWVARMIFSGLALVRDGRPEPTQRVPFRDVFIHPTVLNKQGQRMSKSLGTGVDPLELIEEYGADATRFGLMYQMSYDNQAIKFDEAAIASARNFGNKLWNLARLLDSLPDRDEQSVADDWIEVRLAQTAQEAAKLLETYRLGEAARMLYDFVWKDFADWYVEILKVEGSRAKAKQVFEKTLALLHPFMPHLTEVLWGHAGHEEMLINSSWPQYEALGEVSATKQIEYLKEIVTTIRSMRVLLNISPSVVIKLYLSEAVMPETLSRLARVELIDASLGGLQLPLSSGRSLELVSDQINPESLNRARGKLANESDKIKSFIAREERNLSAMRAKAPAEIVTAREQALKQSQQRLREIENSQKVLSEQG